MNLIHLHHHNNHHYHHLDLVKRLSHVYTAAEELEREGQVVAALRKDLHRAQTTADELRKEMLAAAHTAAEELEREGQVVAALRKDLHRAQTTADELREEMLAADEDCKRKAFALQEQVMRSSWATRMRAHTYTRKMHS